MNLKENRQGETPEPFLHRNATTEKSSVRVNLRH
jgi:hypothetical protein